MICENNFVFRKGRKGDKLPSVLKSLDENDFPDFVLELSNKQVAAACTKDEENHILFISSFDWGKGYCTKFLELWEQYARENGYSELIVSGVDSGPLEHILEKKRMFSFEREDRMTGKIYRKDLQKRKRE
jgi:hypothetical protein